MEFKDVWAAVVKIAVEQARCINDDHEALKVQSLYKQWDKQIGNKLEIGEFIQYNGRLYRVLQAHTAQSNWIPGQGTESLYVGIDKDHDGTKDDPIPYRGNMELFNGKYYEQNDILYLCTRDSGTPLYHDLANLVGLYVEIIPTEIPNEPDGTKDDPIPYTTTMELKQGLYYVENNILYLCILNSGVPLYHNLSNLVGLYVKVDNTNYL